MEDIVMEVFIHGHYETGRPIEVDFYKVKGEVLLEWLLEILRDRGEDVAELFYEHLKTVNSYAWFKVRPLIEVGDNYNIAYYYEVLGLVTNTER